MKSCRRTLHVQFCLSKSADFFSLWAGWYSNPLSLDTPLSDQTSEFLAEVVEETEARCPVYNLVFDAGVNIEMKWIAKPIG